jgi:trehalose 2-sulfotransferase
MAEAYVIATTPRTGSYLLCEGLIASRVAGFPEEYAGPEDTATWRDYARCSSHIEYFGGYVERGRSPNGVFGAKLMWLQFVSWGQDARRYLGCHDATPDIVRALIGPYSVVRLIREDRVRQAVSWVRARETGQWSRRATDTDPPAGLPAYDAHRIRSAVALIERHEISWDAVLQTFDAPVLRVAYEALESDYHGTVNDVLGFLGLEASTSIPDPVLVRQADEVTEGWVARARADLGQM